MGSLEDPYMPAGGQFIRPVSVIYQLANLPISLVCQITILVEDWGQRNRDRTKNKVGELVSCRYYWLAVQKPVSLTLGSHLIQMKSPSSLFKTLEIFPLKSCLDHW